MCLGMHVWGTVPQRKPLKRARNFRPIFGRALNLTTKGEIDYGKTSYRRCPGW